MQSGADREELIAWITLHASGLSNARLRALVAAFGSARAALQASDEEIAGLPGFSALHARKIRRVPEEADPAKLLATIEENGWSLLPITQARYPVALREIGDPPALLFVEGELGGPEEACVAIVGTRKCTPYGRRMARGIARDLAARGITVVSGMALGIDAEAHQGALDAGGRTIAVLGCGIDITYPSQHRALRQRIAEAGAVLSELPMGTKPTREQFPRRNRIISGLSLATVVVEAPAGSGALITARLAAEQGREVFAVPGDVTRPESRGCNELVRDGATLVQSADDVLEGLGVSLQMPASPAHDSAARLSPDEKAVLETLEGQEKTVDEIVGACGLEAARVMAALMLLEVKGAVRRFGGGSYGKVDA